MGRPTRPAPASEPSRYAGSSSTRSRPCPFESTRRSCSRHRAAATSTASGSALASRRPPWVAAGIEHRRLVDQRHTFATWAIESGVQLWYLARIMGTSVTQLEDTYARWLKRTDDQLREAFDVYDLDRAAETN